MKMLRIHWQTKVKGLIKEVAGTVECVMKLMVHAWICWWVAKSIKIAQVQVSCNNFPIITQLENNCTLRKTPISTWNMRQVKEVGWVHLFSFGISLQKRVVHLFSHGKSTIGQSKWIEKVLISQTNGRNRKINKNQKRFSQLQTVITVVKAIAKLWCSRNICTCNFLCGTVLNLLLFLCLHITWCTRTGFLESLRKSLLQKKSFNLRRDATIPHDRWICTDAYRIDIWDIWNEICVTVKRTHQEYRQSIFYVHTGWNTKCCVCYRPTATIQSTAKQIENKFLNKLVFFYMNKWKLHNLCNGNILFK